MLTSLRQSLAQPVTYLGLRPPIRRALIFVAAAIFALLSATVVIGQASQDFDLACRSVMPAGGGTISGGNFGVIAALGMPVVPPQDSTTAPTYSVRGGNFGVRAGFLPAYPTNQSAASADSSIAATVPQQDFVQRLPLIGKIRFLIRGGC